MLDASAMGALVDKTPVVAKILIAKRALNAQQYESVGQRDIPRLPNDAKSKELHQVCVECALCQDILMINVLN
ncbi:hypothetical protein ACFX10_013429 [Malus domestica]